MIRHESWTVKLSEQAIQAAVIQHLRRRAPRGAFWWHNWSGGYRRWRDAAIAKSLGVVAGLPDLMIVYDGKLYCLELKILGGRPSVEQLAVKAVLEANGAFCAITEGLDCALAVLEAWGLLLGKR
jgi:hypothetical protein